MPHSLKFQLWMTVAGVGMEDWEGVGGRADMGGTGVGGVRMGWERVEVQVELLEPRSLRRTRQFSQDRGPPVDMKTAPCIT